MMRTDLEYLKTAAQDDEGLGLLIALYDTLAGDIRRAAASQRSNNLETRGRHVNHAILLIGYLEDWVRRGSGGELADQLIAFYTSLRRNLIEAEIHKSAGMFEQQMARVLELRQQWQRFEDPLESSDPEIMEPAANGPAGYSATSGHGRQNNWSA